MSYKKTKFRSWLFKGFKWLVKRFYLKIETVGMENLPEESVVIVGNHAQLHGPLAGELYFPGKRQIWCAGQMMHLKDVPSYAFQDFWSRKPKYSWWFYKMISYAIAPLSVFLFNNAHTIGVYRDARIMTTFRKTISALQAGDNVIIFPEHDEEYNHILYAFQDKFIDIAKLYYKRTGKELCFVPLYVAPYLKTMYLGAPIRFDAENSMEQERKRICEYLMAEITEIACGLPQHIVVPYRNIPKKYYTTNVPKKESVNEKAGC